MKRGMASEEWEAFQLNEIEQQMSADLERALQAPEVRQHAGKLVAVYQKRVVAVGTERDALVAQAAEKENCPWEDLVVVVVPGPDLTEIPR